MRHLHARSFCAAWITVLGVTTTTVAYSKPPPPPTVVPCSSYEEVPYAKLGSPTFAKDFDGKCVQFDAQFRGEWTNVFTYKMYGVPVDGRVFVNHRAVDYSETLELGASSDITMTSFSLAVPKDKSAFVYEWAKGTKMVVNGRVTLYVGVGDVVTLLVDADEVHAANPAPAVAPSTAAPPISSP